MSDINNTIGPLRHWRGVREAQELEALTRGNAPHVVADVAPASPIPDLDVAKRPAEPPPAKKSSR